MRRLATYLAFGTVVGALGLGVFACSAGGGAAGGGQGTQKTVGGEGSFEGSITIDGSSTVEPILSAVAEEFRGSNPNAQPVVGTSGTGGGFKKFCAGEIDIANASRPIKDSEIEACKAGNVEFIELPIAFDGLSVVVHPGNTWANSLTVAELKKIWEPGSKVDSWDDIRAGFPKSKITLYGAGTDSGTFDYFTEAVVGKSGASRPDYQASEDDNVLVTGVSGDTGSLGYFGYAYFENNKDKLKLVAIEGVKPSPETIANGKYKPLSRPLFIYVSKAALAKPQVAGLVKFMLDSGKPLITQSGYVPLPDDAYGMAGERLDNQTAGSVFSGAPVGLSIQDVMKREAAGEGPAKKA